MIINIIYDFLIIHFIEPLAKLNNFPNIIQGIGLALLNYFNSFSYSGFSGYISKEKGKGICISRSPCYFRQCFQY